MSIISLWLKDWANSVSTSLQWCNITLSIHLSSKIWIYYNKESCVLKTRRLNKTLSWLQGLSGDGKSDFDAGNHTRADANRLPLRGKALCPVFLKEIWAADLNLGRLCRARLWNQEHPIHRRKRVSSKIKPTESSPGPGAPLEKPGIQPPRSETMYTIIF